MLESYLLLKGRGKYPAQLEATNEQIDQVSVRLRKAITGCMERRIQKAYPKAAGLIAVLLFLGNFLLQQKQKQVIERNLF